MKKLIGILIASIMLFSLFMPVKIVNATNLSESIILQLTETHTESQININVKLVNNSGISGMTLELDYNNNVFEYIGYESGTALESLDLISTDLSVDPNLPVKFNWLSQNVKNDFSTGTILKLHFNLKQNISSGEYKIGFKYKDGDIVCIKNGNPYSKSAIISKAVISVSKNKITKTEIVEEKVNNTDWILILGIVMFASAMVVLAVAVVRIIIRKRKSKNWVKI